MVATVFVTAPLQAVTVVVLVLWSVPQVTTDVDCAVQAALTTDAASAAPLKISRARKQTMVLNRLTKNYPTHTQAKNTIATSLVYSKFKMFPNAYDFKAFGGLFVTAEPGQPTIRHSQ